MGRIKIYNQRYEIDVRCNSIYCVINLLTMSTIENVITNTVLIFLADFRNVTPYVVNVVEEFIAAIAFIFLATQFT